MRTCKSHKMGKNNGLFITFEGIHGCGKSTLMSMLAKKLRDSKLNVVSVVDQQGTRIGRELRKINLETRYNSVDYLTEALLVAASRRQNVVEIIKPNLASGRIVLCERYNDAFFAFQGIGRGLDINLLECISAAVAEGVEPDLTFLLDIDPQIAISRLELFPKHRIEKEAITFHNRVREGYLAQAKKHPDRIIVLNTALQINDVFDNIWKEVEKVLVKGQNIC